MSESKGLKDFNAADQSRIQDMVRTVNDLSRDIELAQTKIDLAQARITRVNEVLIPALVRDLRKEYELPDEAWDFDLRAITFTRKPPAS